jgi:hypothetical protein
MERNKIVEIIHDIYDARKFMVEKKPEHAKLSLKMALEKFEGRDPKKETKEEITVKKEA